MRSPRIASVAALLAACVPAEGPLMRPGEDCLECHGGGTAPGEPPTVADREGARRWTVAGTVYATPDAPAGRGVRGAKVHLRDANGWAFTLETNLAGNFYTAEPVRFPLAVAVEHEGRFLRMPDPVEWGGCSGCHRLPPRQGAPGRVSAVASDGGTGPLMRPGQDCLECHGDGPVPGEPPTVADRVAAAHRWTVAGTVYPTPDAPEGPGVAGATVHVVDATGRALTLETNLAGNFYSAEPLAFPLEVTVQHAGRSASMEDPVPYGGCNGCHRLPPRQEAPGRVSAAGDGEEDASPP
jgi:hypothetical protein